MRFRFPILEEGGAGEEGTKKLVKRYKKDTPGESVDEVYRNSGLGKWFSQSAGGGPGWDRYNTKGERVGKCGDSKPGEGKPKCLSPQKAQQLRSQGGTKAIANAVKRKKAQDPQQDRPGTGNKPINVSNRIKKESVMRLPSGFLTEKNKPTSPDKWSDCISQAKSKFDVYPSAYANAWAAKCYKKKGGGWKKVGESVMTESVNPKNIDPTGYYGIYTHSTRNINVITGPYSSEKQAWRDHGGDVDNILTGAELTKRLKKGEYKKFTLTVRDRLRDHVELDEDWQKVNRQDKTDGLSQKAVDAYRRENPGSKLQTAVTEKKPTGKRAARRKSFCSRMKGMKKRLTSAETANDPDSRINKALRRWNC